MAVCEIDTGRFSSKDILIQYLPCGESGTHVQHLRFNANVTAGTFRLRVNGALTAAITFSATIATLLASINAALDALSTLAAGEIVATGTLVSDVTLTALAPKFYEVLLEADLLTGNTTADPNVTTDVTTQGSTLYTLSAQISEFSYEVSVDTVEVTAIGEYEATEIPVKESMTFDISMYEAEADWLFAVRAGHRGTFYVYPRGKVSGRRYFAFNGLIDTLSPNFPDHDIVDKSISGMRQGAMVIPFDALYEV